MRFASDDGAEYDEDRIPQQTQDDLVACWTALLWAKRVLPSVNAGRSMQSSTFKLPFSSLTYTAEDVLKNVLT